MCCDRVGAALRGTGVPLGPYRLPRRGARLTGVRVASPRRRAGTTEREGVARGANAIGNARDRLQLAEVSLHKKVMNRRLM